MKKRIRKLTKSGGWDDLRCLGRRKGLWVGIDLHKEVMQVEVQSSAGVVLLNGAFSTDSTTARELLSHLAGRVRGVAIEATGFWYWFSDLCQELGVPLALANPRTLRVIADSVKKCDRLDAHWICEFLRQDYLDEASIPAGEARDRRELLRTRQEIKAHVQRLKQRVRSFMNQYRLRTRTRDPFCARGLKELRSFECREWPRRSLDHLLNALVALQEELSLIDAEVEEVAQEDVQANLLQEEVRGLGPILATTILAEAMDVTRFASASKFAAFTGIVPKVRESAGKQGQAGITKRGPRHLRWALVQAAHMMVRNDPVVKRWYERHRKRKGASRAYVMVDHKLARYVHMFCVQGLCYEAEKLFPPVRRGRKAA